LIAAIIAALFWLLIRSKFLTNPEREGIFLLNLRAAYIPAFGSMMILVVAILFAICKFAKL
jgi:hypothetical protein